MDVLSSRILLRPADPGRSRRFYRDTLGLAVYREFGSPANPGVVFFLGPGLLEVSGSSGGPAGNSVQIWLQVRDVHAEHERLAAAGVRVLRAPVTEPWGLIEMWIEDPDGVRIVLVEVPPDHPLRRDSRSAPPPPLTPPPLTPPPLTPPPLTPPPLTPPAPDTAAPDTAVVTARLTLPVWRTSRSAPPRGRTGR